MLDIDRFEWLDPLVPPENDVAYLTSAKALLSCHALLPIKNLVCCGTPDAQFMQSMTGNVLVLPNEEASDALMTKLQEIILKYNKWRPDIAMHALRGDDFNSPLADLASMILGNPLFFFNPSDLCVLYKGKFPEGFDDPDCLALIEGIRSGLPSTGFKMNAEAESKKTPYIFRTTPQCSLLVTNIFVDDVRYGKIIYCDTSRPFSKGFMSLAQYFCEFMEILTNNAIKNERIGSQSTNFLIELLSKPRFDERWFAYNNALNLGKNEELRLVLSIGNQESRSSSSYLAYISSKMQRAFPQSSTFVYEKSVVTLLSGNAGDFEDNDLGDQLNSINNKKDISFGISMPFRDLRRLRFFYRQCESALAFLEEGEAEDEGKLIQFYDSECFFDEFLKRYKIDIDYQWLIHPKVYLLNMYDLKNDSDYVRCLQTFIECGCNIKSAASLLLIHYNTLIYRLDRIKEISGLDPRASNIIQKDCFHILLSCKLLTKRATLRAFPSHRDPAIC